MLVIFILLPLVLGQRPSVTIRDGTLTGIPMETWLGRQIAAFRRIPFAAPPTGIYRFQPPQPVTPWTTPLDAGLLAPSCPQPGPPLFSSSDEDCLYLNVFTPQLPSQSNPVSLPVIVYIHGGTFMYVSGADYGPRYLLDYDIVLVTINYRLGALGFLSTGDSVVPGNMGLKDQVAALRWVKNNIAAFGGNPEEVTIGGTSVGGSSVQYHFLSNMSRGLFKRGICMSGSTLIPAAYEKGNAFKLNFLASRVNCSTNSSLELLNCLRGVAVEDLLNVQTMLTDYFYITPDESFGPTVEVGGQEPFLTQYPYQLLTTGNVQPGSILFSLDTQEGLYPAAAFLTNSSGMSALNNNFQMYAPSLLDFLYTVPTNQMNLTSALIREFYFGSQPITIELNQTIIQMVGDRTITNGVENAARLESYTQPDPIYFYQFGYRGQYSLITELLTGSDINFGVGHGDDTVYIFNATYITPSENTPTDREMIQVMSSLWANFAINGYPSVGSNISWPPLNMSSGLQSPLDYMFIGSPTYFIPSRTTGFGHPTFWSSLPINEPSSGPTFSH